MSDVCIIKFNNGIIKVNKSKDTKSIIKKHIIDAMKYGVYITRICTKFNSHISEDDLIKYCRSNSKKVYGEKEYFEELDFNLVVNFLNK